MHKLKASIIKEALILLRDKGALIILFIMPLALILAITLIQQGSFKKLSNVKVPVLWLDLDAGITAQNIKDNLGDAFEIVETENGEKLSPAQIQDLVFKGKYQMGIVIPQNLSAAIEKKVSRNVERILQDMGMIFDSLGHEELSQPKQIEIYFDPSASLTFKSAVKNSIDKMVAQMESHTVYLSFQEQLGGNMAAFSREPLIQFKEILPKINEQEYLPNATQHNVPAWTLFAIYFIVIPLSINLSKENSLGTNVRLRTLPVHNGIVLLGKGITFLAVCLIQFYLMLLVGIYLFPFIGLEPLNVHGKLLSLSVVALFSGIAAIGFGILVGTIWKTQEQAAPFGATSVVVMAALGGVWVPVFLMPKFMQTVSQFSPMNWGLNAFYDVLLRNAGIFDLIPKLGLLLLFSGVCMGISMIYDEKKRTV